MTTDQRRVDNIEIFRGICALLVVCWHSLAHINHHALASHYPALFAFADALKSVFLKISTYAVLGFFVISGFVITRSIIRTTYKNNTFPLYFINRFLRLASLCAPAALISVPLSYYYRTTHNITNAWDKYSSFTFSSVAKSAIGISAQWNGPGWTLGYEWQFYLLVAVPFLLMRPTIKTILFSMAVIVYVTLGFDHYPLGAIPVSFLFGIIALFIYTHVPHVPIRTRWCILIVSLGVIAWQIYLLPNSYDDSFLRAVPLLGIMIFALYEKNYSGRLYAALLHLGKISFSLYIWHWPVLMFGNWYFGNSDVAQSFGMVVLIYLVLIPASFVIAHFSYLYIERNARLEKIPPLYRLYLKYIHKPEKLRIAQEPSPW